MQILAPVWTTIRACQFLACHPASGGMSDQGCK